MLQEAGEGAHGVVLGQSLANQRGHVFNVTLQGGSLKVIDVSQAGTGFEGLKSIEFMLMK